MPDRCGLLLHSGLPAGHRGPRRRPALPVRDHSCSSRSPSSGLCRSTAASPRRARTARAPSRCWNGCCSFWKGKLFVLVLLGFAATDFLITITLSAVDATTHLVENPHLPSALHDQQVLVTLILVAPPRRSLPPGFLEAIGIAVDLVGVYLALNVVIDRGTVARDYRGQRGVDWSTAADHRARGPPRDHRAWRWSSSRSSRWVCPASRPASR